ncbi:contactin-1 isoform X2 [Sitophilus oryzae]|uniref:Contactin-1 isoform X2 n=1 Tax=Sitophilus oryzae TaxID=7048 RepID=A0A6J2XGC5_SITOR|nr:contactin-1 isoform X2 [Sitophilus oryzae]
MYNTLGPVLCFVFFIIIVKGAIIKKVSVDIGKNITIQCPLHKSKDIMWEREGRTADQNIMMNLLNNGSLFLQEVDKNDSAVYSCGRENDVTDIRARVNLTVRTPPSPLIVSIKPSTIIALILWEVNGTGGYPIINFTAQYRLAYNNSSWIPISPNHITPNSRQVEVFNLTPNTTYEFRIWATNQLGKSPVVNVFGTTKKQYPEQEGADKFDTRWWAVAVGIVMGTLVLLGIGTCTLLYQECRVTTVEEEQEIIELVPNIILNPGFEGTSRNEPDENSNNEIPMRLNNNTTHNHADRRNNAKACNTF